VEPNRASVKRSIEEYNNSKDEKFLDKYSSGRSPRAHYLVHANEFYPLKAVWAAAHRPSAHTREFQTADARRGLRALGFDTFVEGSTALQFEEGKRIFREGTTLARDPILVEFPQSPGAPPPTPKNRCPGGPPILGKMDRPTGAQEVVRVHKMGKSGRTLDGDPRHSHLYQVSSHRKRLATAATMLLNAQS
jgi:hypothetical protein